MSKRREAHELVWLKRHVGEERLPFGDKSSFGDLLSWLDLLVTGSTSCVAPLRCGVLFGG